MRARETFACGRVTADGLVTISFDSPKPSQSLDPFLVALLIQRTFFLGSSHFAGSRAIGEGGCPRWGDRIDIYTRPFAVYN